MSLLTKPLPDFMRYKELYDELMSRGLSKRSIADLLHMGVIIREQVRPDGRPYYLGKKVDAALERFFDREHAKK